MIIRPYGSEKFDKPGFETFYETIIFGKKTFKYLRLFCRIIRFIRIIRFLLIFFCHIQNTAGGDGNAG